MASPERQGWDTRAWKTGLISSNMCGLLLAIAAITERSHPGRGALTLHHYGAGYASGLLATLIANFVLPAILTLISKRKFLFWGLLCPLIFAGWALSTRYLRGQTYHLHRDMITIPFLIFLSVILISGPISLTRFIRRLRQEQRAAKQARVVAQREAASVPREGVWPPPPDYKP